MSISDVEHCEELCVHQELVARAMDELPDEDKLYDLAELFKVFGDSTRIRILYVLFQTSLCVCDLAEALHMTQSAISHQLKILKQAKLVTGRREGKSVFYSCLNHHKTIVTKFSCQASLKREAGVRILLFGQRSKVNIRAGSR